VQTGQRIAIIGMTVSAGLAALKISTGLLGGSNSLLADGFESAGDVFSSGMVLLGLTLAAKPPDSNHPYGHGRAETLSGLGLGMLLILAGIAISFHALTGAGDVTEPPRFFTLYPLLLSIGVKLWLMRVKYKTGRAMGSASLVADSYNDGIDMLSGIAALIALGLTLHNPVEFPLADHYGGFAIGLIVIFTGVRVTRDTGLQLMDTMPDDALLRRVRQVAQSVSGVEGVEKCFARKTGLQYHVDLHLEVNPAITVLEGHDIASRARDEIKAQLEWVADVLVHVEPTGGFQAGQLQNLPKNLPKLPELVLDPARLAVRHEPFGDQCEYFNGPTDQLSLMVAGSLTLKSGMSPHPPHKHPEEEFLLVTEGTGEIEVAGTTTKVGPGSMMYCAGDRMHGIKNTGPAPLTFFYYKWKA
jgi:cation diffusion facilitator family transporter